MNRIGFSSAVFGLIVLFAAVSGRGQETQSASTEDLMKIRIVVGNHALPATLENSSAARKFAQMLPLELKLEDYHATEKIADLPSRLPNGDAPEGIDPDAGDITYFAPWGNLAIFYRDFGYFRGLVRLGRIEGSLAVLSGKGALKARIERIDTAE
jgi:hypothetical protein